MKESERLRAAKKLIDSPEKWIQGDYYDLPGDAKNSVCFCSLGAIQRVYVDSDTPLMGDLNRESLYLERALHELEVLEGDIPTFNDTHNHEEVMQMFDKAIEIAESEGN